MTQFLLYVWSDQIHNPDPNIGSIIKDRLVPKLRDSIFHLFWPPLPRVIQRDFCHPLKLGDSYLPLLID